METSSSFREGAARGGAERKKKVGIAEELQIGIPSVYRFIGAGRAVVV